MRLSRVIVGLLAGTVLVAFAVALVTPLVALASAGDYPNPVPGFPAACYPNPTNGAYSAPANRYDAASAGLHGECTWYVWGRTLEKLGRALPTAPAAGGYWNNQSLQGAGIDQGQVPRANSIAVWAGHVAFVEEVNGDIVTYTEANWDLDGVPGGPTDHKIHGPFTKTTAQMRATGWSGAFQGYVYVGGAGNKPSLGWWGPWAGAPVIACEPNSTWLRVNDNGSALSWVDGSAYFGGGWNYIGRFWWAGGSSSSSDFKADYWFPLNTSQKVALRGNATNGVGTSSSDYVRYVTDERWFVTGDFDGNGRSDVVRMVDDGNSAMSIWLGRSDGTRWSFTKGYSSGAGNWSRLLTQAVAGDVDGDGKDEIVALYRYGDNSSGIWVFDWNGTAFTGRKPYHAASGKEWYKMKPMCGDIDGDGREELVVAFDYDGWNGYDTGMLSWDLEATAAPEPIAPWTETHNGWWGWSSSYFLAGDFDGDGRDEVAAYYDYGGGVTGLWIFDGLSGGKFTAIDKRHNVTGWGFSADKATVGDLDGDGRDEIAHLYNYAGGTVDAIGLWTTDIDGATVSYARRWTAPAGSWDWARTRPMAADVDADGKDEFFTFYDYGSSTAREAWGAWFWRPDVSNWAGAKIWNKASGSWGLAPNLNGSFANPVTSSTVSASSPCVFGAGRVSGRVKTSSGGPVSARRVTLQVLNGSTWGNLGTATTDARGYFSVSITPTRRSSYRVAFPGDTIYRASVSPIVIVTPRVYLSAPSAPSIAYKGRAFSSTSYLKPRHSASTCPVRLLCYRYEKQSNGTYKWVHRKSVSAKALNYSSYTKVSAAVSLPHTGKWRIRAYHAADSLNAATYSSYRYVTVK